MLSITILGSIYRIKIRPKLKGWTNEVTIETLLKTLNKNEYIILRNILIEKENKETSQIDLLILSIYGTFIIESKNYDGIIKGNDTDHQWTQILGQNKYYFMNPLHQVYSQSFAIANTLDIKREDIIPIVVFSANSELKVNTSKNVIYLLETRKVIRSYKEKQYSTEQIIQFRKIIENQKITDKERITKHSSDVAQKKSSNKNKCPRCSGDLIERNGKYGKFIGCSNYPKCKYTQKVKS